jgi:hypothetical protein
MINRLVNAIMLVVLLPGMSMSGQLIQGSDMTYLGAFRVPQGNYNGQSYGYGGYGLAYNPTNNSLFTTGLLGRAMAEFEVAVPDTSSNIESLNVGTNLQGFYDIWEGNFNNIGEDGAECLGNGNIAGGLMLYNGLLYGTVWAYYDGAYCAQLSHYTTGLDLSVPGDFDGYYRVGDTSYNVGIRAYYMCEIPTEWQASFGGANALTGRCFDPILGRTSFGPSISTFYPDSLGVVEPSPSTVLLWYASSGDMATLGNYQDGHDGGGGSPNPYISPADNVSGVVFAEGTDTVLFIGSHGAGEWCYKCEVPNNPAGNGAYPYVYFAWAYDANDLAAVYQGDYEVTQNDYDTSRFLEGNWPNNTVLAVGDTVRPWNVVPYDVWELETSIFPSPEQINIPRVRGGTFDPIENRVYFTAYGADGVNDKPLIHVFDLDTGDAPPSSISAPDTLAAGRTP